ncbi:MAG: hypothetical protein H6815_08640 [Phycisphaeraceae bacterium]|nr:hypothetical protein [Phycisphaerales bacterium]MCB9860509.1 hypothetical protein [Phycisphaeraceae bacterium]
MMTKFSTLLKRSVALSLVAMGLGAALPQTAQAQGGLFLIDDSFQPHVKVSWPTIDGEDIVIERDMPYAGATDLVDVGHNIRFYTTVGGTRLTSGAGHPDGAIVRSGLYKVDPVKPLFERITEDGVVTIEMSNVKFNQPAGPHEGTVLHHLKYTLADIASCGLSASAMDQYNTQDPKDTMKDKISDVNGRLGALDGDTSKGHGSAKLTLEDDGTITCVVKVPYAYFRHVRDPWQRTTPGTFFEPYHFHVEFESLPTKVLKELEAEEATRDADTTAES